MEGRAADSQTNAGNVAQSSSNRLTDVVSCQGDRFRMSTLSDALAAFRICAKAKVISEALGHASVAFTMDTYSHIIEGMQSDAMALLDGVLPPGKNGASQKITPK